MSIFDFVPRARSVQYRLLRHKDTNRDFEPILRTKYEKSRSDDPLFFLAIVSTSFRLSSKPDNGSF